MGCCESQSNTDSNNTLVTNNQSGKQAVTDHNHEIENFDKKTKDQSHSKQEQSISQVNNQNNLLNSKVGGINTSHTGGQVVVNPVNINNSSTVQQVTHHNETQPDVNDKINTENSIDIGNNENGDDDDDTDEDDDQVFNIIEQLINHKRENMES